MNKGILKILELLQHQLSSCHGCGGWMGRKGLFCRSCESQNDKFLVSDQRTLSALEYEFKATSQFTWIEDESLPISRLIMSMKAGSSLRASQHWGEILALKWGARTDLSNWVVIPAPRPLGAAPDHAFWLAHAVAKTLNLPLLDILRKAAQMSHKDGGKHERFLGAVVCHEKISTNCSVLFVDDVLTTGATAVLSYKALLQPPNFEILVLARRTLATDISR